MKSTASPSCSTNFPYERWWDRGYNKHLGASGWHLPISGPNHAPNLPHLQLPSTQILLIRGSKWVTVSSATPRSVWDTLPETYNHRCPTNRSISSHRGFELFPDPPIKKKKQKQEDITHAGVTHWPGQISQTFSHHLIMFQYRGGGGASIHKHFHWELDRCTCT